jgi:hypothetical protein
MNDTCSTSAEAHVRLLKTGVRTLQTGSVESRQKCYLISNCQLIYPFQCALCEKFER